MEVELSVLHATDLRKKYECYAKVKVQMDDTPGMNEEIKLGDTDMSREEHTPAGRKSATSTTNPVWRKGYLV